MIHFEDYERESLKDQLYFEDLLISEIFIEPEIIIENGNTQEHKEADFVLKFE